MISRFSSSISSFFSHTASAVASSRACAKTQSVASRAISSTPRASGRILARVALITVAAFSIALIAKYVYSTFFKPVAAPPDVPPPPGGGAVDPAEGPEADPLPFPPVDDAEDPARIPLPPGDEAEADAPPPLAPGDGGAAAAEDLPPSAAS